MANDSKSIKAHKFLLKISKHNKHTKFNDYLCQSNIISIESRMDKQNDLQVKMMEMAAEHGALTPEVMQEFLRQQTAQKAIDGTDSEDSSSSS